MRGARSIIAGFCLFAIAWMVSACDRPGSRPPAQERVARATGRVRADLDQALRDAGAQSGDPLFIRIFKEESELEVWLRPGENFVHVASFEICAWSGGLGPKLREGDRQAPEGFYFVNRGRMNPNSRYHLAFNLGYPNAYDRSHGRTGSALMVHGDCVSIGCYAMTDAGIEQIYGLADAALDNGQEFFRVHAFPFRMNEENLSRHGDSEWHGFWLDLKQGHDLFEATGIPPDVGVENGRYVFEATPEISGKDRRTLGLLLGIPFGSGYRSVGQSLPGLGERFDIDEERSRAEGPVGLFEHTVTYGRKGGKTFVGWSAYRVSNGW